MKQRLSKLTKIIHIVYKNLNYSFYSFNLSHYNWKNHKAINPHINVLVFRTDIKTELELGIVGPYLNRHSLIREWSIDRTDIDNVLRIETKEELTEQEVVLLIKSSGFECEALPD